MAAKNVKDEDDNNKEEGKTNTEAKQDKLKITEENVRLEENKGLTKP